MIVNLNKFDTSSVDRRGDEEALRGGHGRHSGGRGCEAPRLMSLMSLVWVYLYRRHMQARMHVLWGGGGRRSWW